MSWNVVLNKFIEMNTFYMLVGLPGSGKSWQAKKIMESDSDLVQVDSVQKNTVWVSSDAIREELYGEENMQGNATEVFSEMKRRTDAALRDGNDVVYDACNINSKRRRGLLNSLSYFKGRKSCIICATPYQECLRRNSQRDRVVPDEVIRRMYMNWNTPYFSEGWDDIRMCFADGYQNSLEDPEGFAELRMNFVQDNPNHTESLGEHVTEARRWIVEQTGLRKDDNLAIAAILHDCGKPFTKTFVNSRGEVTDIAHYYQHACVGAYDAMFYDYKEKTDQDILEICLLINLHMNPFSWNKDETVEKQIKLLGADLVSKLQLLHKADETASHRV